MKTYILIIYTIIVGLIIYTLPNPKPNHIITPAPITAPIQNTYETDDTHFVNNQILYPDYAHSDTLIVIQADSLNWYMAHYDIASDGDINDVLHAFCTKY